MNESTHSLADDPSSQAGRPTDALPIAAAAPVRQADRIQSIDVLRGFALLGILVMNIQSFAMIGAAYANPSIYGNLEGANYAVWLISHLFTDLKMMAIFSMLFGAGIILMTERAEATDRSPAGLHYSRMATLLLFGLAHAYLLWFGDILFMYSVCGMIVYSARKLRPAALIGIALALVTTCSLIYLSAGLSAEHWPKEDLLEMDSFVNPSPDAIRDELAAYHEGYWAIREHQAPMAVMSHTQGLLLFAIWRIGGMMLLGMALYKLGVFSARRSRRFYGTMVVAGFLIGLPIIWTGVQRHEAMDWDTMNSMFVASQFNYWGSLFVAMAWIGVIMLVCKSGALPSLRGRLSAVGQMALTNYLMQTIICTTIFYGYGFDAFGRVQRIGQIGIVVAVWAFQLWYSPIWLRHYRFGPFEWLWRTMTYMRKQPLKRPTPLPQQVTI